VTSKTFGNLLGGYSTKNFSIIARFFLERANDFSDLQGLGLSVYFNLFNSTLNNAFLMVERL